MSELKTPDSVIQELVSTRAQSSKGIQAQYYAEVKLAEATLAAETEEAKAFLSCEGTVADRQAVAKVRAGELHFQADLAKAELNRVKTKIRLLEQAQMSVQTQARLVELTYKTAGLGER